MSQAFCLSFDQADAGICDYGICPIITGLVEDSPQARCTGIGVQLEKLSEVSIGQDGCCCVQSL